MSESKVCKVCGDLPMYCTCHEGAFDYGDLENAIEIAVRAHRWQLDKAGQPYILHPLRVMHKVDSEEERIVAVLHDVVEDSFITIEHLKEKNFSETILRALRLLTKKPDDDYFKYVKRIAINTIAKKVKLADLEDNMDLSRLPEVTEKDRERLAKYKKAKEILLSK